MLFRLFVGSLRQTLPRHYFPGKQLRFLTSMDVATTAIEVKEPDTTVKNKVVTRYKRRFMKRQWEDGGRKDGETGEKKVCNEPFERIKRKKMAMLLGYCGVDYYGMQRNPGVITIEEVLLKAMLEAKYVTEEDFNNQQNAQFQRSSRTDKGVSAARQVISMKLPLEVDIEEINKRLPESIRVFGVKRVTNKFNSKVKCNARSYSYTLPTYVFEPSLVSEEERKQYRIPKEKLEQISQVLGVYKGTKSYHNFTEKKHYQDPSASRYMMGFNIDKVFVDSDMEFAVLVVKGQSFMLHQIRKMVGLAIAVVRGHAAGAVVERAFGRDKVMVPTAPGLGLVLDMVHYDRYDTKFKESHASLTWHEEEAAVQDFKHKHIYPVIVKGEVEGNSMGLWLEKLAKHSYEPSEDAPDKEEVGDDDDDDGAERDDDDNDSDVGGAPHVEVKHVSKTPPVDPKESVVSKAPPVDTKDSVVSKAPPVDTKESVVSKAPPVDTKDSVVSKAPPVDTKDSVVSKAPPVDTKDSVVSKADNVNLKDSGVSKAPSNVDHEEKDLKEKDASSNVDGSDVSASKA